MLPALRVGGRYEARVQRVLADGRVVLVISEVAIAARTRTALRTGSRIVVEVERLVPEPLLRVIRSGRQEVPHGPATVSAGPTNREET